mmetsp:Transcript_65067/g.172327  ORF Transcript_65067/g.172327 Transcript_65067/m.172327 type:complete len:202 (+) Transcript_65067:1729-2334(+)
MCPGTTCKHLSLPPLAQASHATHGLPNGFCWHRGELTNIQRPLASWVSLRTTARKAHLTMHEKSEDRVEDQSRQDTPRERGCAVAGDCLPITAEHLVFPLRFFKLENIQSQRSREHANVEVHYHDVRPLQSCERWNCPCCEREQRVLTSQVFEKLCQALQREIAESHAFLPIRPFLSSQHRSLLSEIVLLDKLARYGFLRN